MVESVTVINRKLVHSCHALSDFSLRRDGPNFGVKSTWVAQGKCLPPEVTPQIVPETVINSHKSRHDTSTNVIQSQSQHIDKQEFEFPEHLLFSSTNSL